MGGRVVRYAVVGADCDVHAAVLTAFVRTRRARLATIVSASGRAQARELAAKHLLARTWSLEEYDECLASGSVDAVYIGLPVAAHREYAVRAARRGVHVLCRKPMAATEQDCIAMMEAAADARIKLMVADRLRFDPANLGAKDTLDSGVLGELRLSTSTVMHGTRARDRSSPDAARDALLEAVADCLGMARRLFRDEPVAVMALPSTVDACTARAMHDTTAAILRFPRNRVATFVCSQAGTRSSQLRVIGTAGELLVEGGYCFEGERLHRLAVGARTRERRFRPIDPCARALDHFADCILEDREPEGSGEETMADVRVLHAISRSARTQRLERLAPAPHETPAKRTFRFPSRMARGSGDALGAACFVAPVTLPLAIALDRSGARSLQPPPAREVVPALEVPCDRTRC